MRVKQLLAAFLLGVGLCFVPALGYGKVRQWRETDINFYMDKYPEEPRRGLYEWQMANNEQWQLELCLLTARVDYMMRNPTVFENVRFFYDPDGRSKTEFPEGVETEDKILVWILDNREMYKTLSGVDLLNLFRAQLEVMYQFLFTEIAGRMNIPISLKTDIVGKFHSGGGIPLGYFYEGECHLWGE